jgi:hypothetical protein
LYQDFLFFQKNSTITYRYRTVRLGAPVKFIILHSKIGRRVDFFPIKNPDAVWIYACMLGCMMGFVPLPGTVGYGATVWDLLPTYPPRITEHGALGVRPTPQNYGTWCRESAELQLESSEIRKFTEHDRALRGTYPYRITEHGAPGGSDLPPRNRGTVAP